MAFMLQQCGPPAPASSRLAALGLKVRDRMAGKFLPFAGVSKEAMNVVSACGGQFILDAPDFLEHQVGAGRSVEGQLLHTFRRLMGRFARG